jgi:hypothetical protein
MKLVVTALLLIFSGRQLYAACPVVESPLEATCMDLAEAVVADCGKNFDQEAKDKKQKYKFNVCNNGKFVLDLDTYFPHATTVEEVYTKYFLNGENIQKSSNLQKGTAPKVYFEGKPYTGSATGLKGKAFKIESHPKKSFSTKELISICSFASDGTIATQTCNLSMTSGDGKDAFKTGKTNSTVIKCTKITVGVKCAVTVKGFPKDIDGILYSNTAEKLAVSGAIETMRDFYNLSYIGHGCDPGPASENVLTSAFYKTNLDPFWKSITSKVENLKGDKSLVTVSSGDDAINIKLIEDTKDHNSKNADKVLDCQN